MRRMLIIGLAVASVCVQAQTYRWVDPAGRTIISDTPPPAQTKAIVQNNDAPDGGTSLPFAVKKAMEAFPVTLYTAANCTTECKQARDLLNGRGVPFSEKTLQKQEDIDELKQLVGDAYVPTLKVGNQRSRGYDVAGYNNLLDLAGYPKTAPYGSKPAGGTSK